MRIILVIFASALLTACLPALGQLSSTNEKAILLKRMIELNHYSPRPVDDSFSVSVFKKVINTADKRRLYLTASEYKQLAAYATGLDDELRGKGWAFLDLFTTLYKRSLQRADSILNKLMDKPLDFSVNETVSSSKEETFNFSADNAALVSRWSRYLKWVVMNRIYESVHADSSKRRTFKDALASMEPSIRQKVKQEELRSVKKIMENPEGFASYASGIYLNAIANTFDPHTDYFSPQGKEEFQAQLSTEAFYFGIELEENDEGKLVIGRLTPGGPAWKSGELNKGDELVSLQWEGKEAVELAGATVEEAYDVLDESVHDRIVFRCRKADGTEAVVFLRKEKLNNEENIVKSFVLKGEKKIGYILLPGFYTEWENETGSSCANDVAKEIVKLKKENIDGLILDVRYNGGGSVGEAIEMTGIFIEDGPLAAEKSKDGKLSTYKDPNRGTIYDGPMALMVNGQSASASEMLAGSLQDYHRAVIVGSNTYGKATMQLMLLMDTTRNINFTGRENQDVVKITMKKLYRLTGKSAQLNGVAPDVVLPDAFDGLDFRESAEKNALPSDTAKANQYYKPLKVLPVGELAKKSADRVVANEGFRDIKKIIEEEKKDKAIAVQVIPLKWDLFEKWVQQHDLNLKTMQGDAPAATQFTVENHTQDKQLIQKDAYTKEINDVWLKHLGRDIYIQETFLVLTDLINLQSPPTKN
jgi:carboxyl-terminal processing protease